MGHKRTFTLYWEDGTKEIYPAANMGEAMKTAGIGSWAQTKLEHILPGTDNSYIWNGKEWIENVSKHEQEQAE